MTTRIGLALALLLTALFFSPLTQAQNKPSVAPVPYHSAAQVSADPEGSHAIGLFTEVPAGKRLVVQYLSLFVRVSNAPTELTQMTCLISGRGIGRDEIGNPVITSHFVQLESWLDTILHSAAYTAGGPMTMYLEPGPIEVDCSAGVRNHPVQELQANLTGELISR